MADVKLNLSIPDPKKFQTALTEAKKHGLSVTQSFADLGIASGSIESKAMSALLHIDGIESVEPDRPVSAVSKLGA